MDESVWLNSIKIILLNKITELLYLKFLLKGIKRSHLIQLHNVFDLLFMKLVLNLYK
jgi:hypothetical protein